MGFSMPDERVGSEKMGEGMRALGVHDKIRPLVDAPDAALKGMLDALENVGQLTGANLMMLKEREKPAASRCAGGAGDGSDNAGGTMGGVVRLFGATNACEGREAQFVFVTRLGRGVGFEETLKLANDPNVLARQRRRLVTGSWESAWFDWHLTRLQAAAREAAEGERSGWKLEYTRGEELMVAYEGGNASE